ncbi:MAG: hypothetical protein ACK59M_16575 [Pseudomonadota bacterium]
MDESGFIASIDCKFPYEDRDAALDLAKQACLLSPNAAFAVVDEVSRPPKGIAPTPQFGIEVLSFVEQHLAHPLATPIIGLAREIVLGRSVSVPEAVLALRQVERFPGQYCALSVAYFACDDVDGIAERELNRIKAAWDAV